MMDVKQVYLQSARQEAAFQILERNHWKEVFQYLELNTNAAKQSYDNDTPLTKALIKAMM